eukprot:gene3372-3697_t
MKDSKIYSSKGGGKKILIIIAHPSTKSTSHRLAQRYTSHAGSLGHEVRVLDLYRDPKALSYVTFEEASEMGSNPQGIYFRELLSWADEYVFFFPVWWMEAPAILKNFYDVSFIAGFAYKYENNSAVGLLKDKSAKFIVTADGPAWAYKLGLAPLITPWKMRLGHNGIKVKCFHILDKRRWRKDDFVEKWAKKFVEGAVTK